MFTDVQARIFHGFFAYLLSWEFSEDTADVGVGTVSVEVSETRDGPFKEIHEEPAISYRALVDAEMERSIRHTPYFRLVLKRPSRPAHISRMFSDALFKSTQQQAIYRAINERQFEELRHRSGMPCLLYSRVYKGPACPDCVDEQTGQHLGTSRCETCWGTGILGGYRAPVEFYVKVAAATTSSEERKNRNPTVAEEDDVFVTPGIPRIYADDFFVVRTRDRRYKVGRQIQHPKMMGAHPIEHRFKGDLISHDDVLMKMPIPEGY